MANPRKTAFILTSIACGMLALGFASKPLYDTFCSITGYGGTTRQADTNTSEIIDRIVTVNFDANVSNGLPWEFKPEVKSIDVKLGQSALAYYTVKNVSDEPIIGTATYNVTPIKSAPYFVKTECFCFTEQRVDPGQEIVMPVLFHVDSRLNEDARFDDITDVTLSYTFFRVKKDIKTAAQSRDVLN